MPIRFLPTNNDSELATLKEEITKMARGVGFKEDGTPQTYVDYSSTRTKDTIYVNDTGAPVTVYLTSTNSTTANKLIVELSVDSFSTSILIRSGSDASTVFSTQNVQCIIPSGYSYRVLNRDPEYWIELR